ncbi:hypothetical protein F52700_5826 [Fusarium sp. NRRL 52700]|nr:hypothetical protein F52700_5826 [Fusarium sp. NRRL 52700]
MDSHDGIGGGDAPLQKFHWNFVVDEEEEWRACSDCLLELFREDLKRKREIEEEEEEGKKKKEKKPRLFFRRWSAPLAPVLSAVPVVAAPATTVRQSLLDTSYFPSSESPRLHQSQATTPFYIHSLSSSKA